MNKFKIILSTIVLVFFLMGETHPDTLLLKNGQIIEGSIINQTDKHLLLDVAGVQVKYYRDEIVSINQNNKPAMPKILATALKVEAYIIPSFSISNRNLNDIALDGKKLYIANDGGWGEFQYDSGKITPSFMAATGNNFIKAITATPNGAAVFESTQNFLMIGKSNVNVQVNQKIEDAAGLVYANDLFYLADFKAKKIFALKVKDNTASVVETFSAPENIRGLAFDGKNFFVCDNTSIYKLDAKMSVVESFKTGVALNGLAIAPSGEFLAVAKSDNIIYILRNY